jgi:hypothetical protein
MTAAILPTLGETSPLLRPLLEHLALLKRVSQFALLELRCRSCCGCSGQAAQVRDVRPQLLALRAHQTAIRTHVQKVSNFEQTEVLWLSMVFTSHTCHPIALVS